MKIMATLQARSGPCRTYAEVKAQDEAGASDAVAAENSRSAVAFPMVSAHVGQKPRSRAGIYPGSRVCWRLLQRHDQERKAISVEGRLAAEW
jgi:hypothetical protein